MRSRGKAADRHLPHPAAVARLQHAELGELLHRAEVDAAQLADLGRPDPVTLGDHVRLEQVCDTYHLQTPRSARGLKGSFVRSSS